MQRYKATVEVDRKGPVTANQSDDVMSRLEWFHPALSSSARGWCDATICVPAESLAQAATVATRLVAVTFDAEAIVCEVMTEQGFDARQELVPMPVPVVATEAAEILGVSRQRVQQYADEGRLRGRLVGRSPQP